MMAINYAKHVSIKQTPQSEPIPGEPQVPNNAGGFVYQVDDWKRLDRFLILGAEGPTYYCTERKMVADNAACVQRCLAADPVRTINRIVEVNVKGLAPKNDPAIFALALAASFNVKEGRWAVARQRALAALPEVCRIGTHLFQFNEMVEQLRGRGRALNRAVANWYLSKETDPGALAYQATKYQQRNGWSHRDLLRLCKPKTKNETLNTIFHWITKGWDSIGELPHPNAKLWPIWAMEKAKRATDKREVVKLINEFGLVRECVPTQFLNEPEVWEALLNHMPMTAMIRNLAKMTAVGLIKPMSSALKKITDELGNVERLKKARIHPIASLAALLTYKQGHGEKGKLAWQPVSQVIDALDGAFYSAFQAVEPTGKRWFLGIDVSGSMWCGSIAGIPNLQPGLAAAALALVTARTEQFWYMAAFNTEMIPFAPSPKQRLDDFNKSIQGLPWGGTDCAQPMLHAIKEKLPVDVFCVLTDNETWAGGIHPCQALRQYRDKTGIPAKLIVVGMTATEFSIADPDDAGTMDVVGFSTDAPAVMADFAR